MDISQNREIMGSPIKDSIKIVLKSVNPRCMAGILNFLGPLKNDTSQCFGCIVAQAFLHPQTESSGQEHGQVNTKCAYLWFIGRSLKTPTLIAGTLKESYDSLIVIGS